MNEDRRNMLKIQTNPHIFRFIINIISNKRDKFINYKLINNKRKNIIRKKN